MYNKEVLAYIIGVAMGDGNLSNPNGRAVRLRITCDTHYPNLITKIQRSIQALMPSNRVSIAKKKGNCVDISCYSNKWPHLLGWNVGAKYTQIAGVPKWITSNTRYTIPFLRGVIETDGAIYYDRGYPAVIFTSIIKPLAYDVYSLIEKLGFRPHIYHITKNQNLHGRYNVRITTDVNQFVQLIDLKKE